MIWFLAYVCVCMCFCRLLPVTKSFLQISHWNRLNRTCDLMCNLRFSVRKKSFLQILQWKGRSCKTVLSGLFNTFSCWPSAILFSRLIIKPVSFSIKELSSERVRIHVLRSKPFSLVSLVKQGKMMRDVPCHPLVTFLQYMHWCLNLTSSMLTDTP